jgi:hypothetical protein
MPIKHRMFRLHHHGGNLGRIQVVRSKVIVLHLYADGATSQEEALCININSLGGHKTEKGGVSNNSGRTKKMSTSLGEESMMPKNSRECDSTRRSETKYFSRRNMFIGPSTTPVCRWCHQSRRNTLHQHRQSKRSQEREKESLCWKIGCH